MSDKKIKKSVGVTVRDITLIGVMVAVIEVCKVTMAALPNIELTTFWIIMFTLFLGRKSIFAIPILFSYYYHIASCHISQPF